MNLIKQYIAKCMRLYKGLPKASYVIFAATTINGMGIFVYPFLTLYLTKLLGYSAVEAGTFLMLASLAYVPGSIIGGKLADSFGRKKVLVISQFLVSLCLGICGFFEVSPIVPKLVLLYLCIDGFADPVRGAIHTDVTNSENRQASFSLGYLGHNLGYSVGPLLAGFLFYRSPRWLFWGNGIAGFLSVLLMMIFIPESKPTKEQVEETRVKNTSDKVYDGGLLKALLSRPQILILALCSSIIGLAYSQTLFALPLYTENIFGEQGAVIFGRLMSLNALVVVFFNAAIVALLKRFNPLKNVVLACVFFALGFAGYAYCHSILSLALLTVLWTLGEIINATNMGYYIANNTPINHRGRFNAIVPIIEGSGRCIGPYLAGFVILHQSLSFLWLLAGICCAIAGLIVYILYRAEGK